MIDYILNALPTAAIVLAHFLRTERRLTRIETILEILIQNTGCKDKTDETS